MTTLPGRLASGSVWKIEYFRADSLLLLCDSVRLKCLLQADELKLAQSTASAVGVSYTELFDAVSVTRLADKITRSSTEQTRDEQALFQKHRQTAQLISNRLQEVTEAAISKPLLIGHLIEHKVSGSRYLEDIAAHDQHPVILLST